MFPIKLAQVIPATKIPINNNQVFSYIAPPKTDLKPGQEVLVPLKNRQVRAVVVKVEDIKSAKQLPCPQKFLKNIEQIVDDKPVLTKEQLELANWMADYYYASLGLVIKTMLWPRLKRLKKDTADKKDQILTKFPKLTSLQAKAYQPIEKTIKEQKYQSFLLHGVTGSGKTEIYMEAIRETLLQDKQAILLVPEISLTPQNIERFAARFGSDKLAILHSRLTGGEKFTEWHKIRSEQAKIIIGPRSAVFAPVQRLGLIIVDEEHDTSYKQYDQNPRYHARQVATKLAELTSATVIMGSATPSLESYHKTQTDQYSLLELPERFTGQQKLPEVSIVDMRQELKKRNYTVFSDDLQAGIETALNNKKQVLLFINRRGAATFVMCRDCGHTLECPHCNISLTYHLGEQAVGQQNLICHHCNFRQESPTLCPQCNSQFIKYFGTGTQKVEHELKILFPEAKVARADRDTMTGKEAYSKIYNAFATGKLDVLIGTQMITKGWDLPGVELVGIVSADVLFNFPDFRGNERAFQMLTQVAGRAGRGQDVGQVILQTYNPGNRVIKTAAAHDYHKFFQTEPAERKQLHYPPFIKLIKIIFTDKDESATAAATEAAAQKLSQRITKQKLPITLLGPAPAFLPKIREKYRWNIILKITDKNYRINKDLFNNLSSKDYTIDVDPEDLL